MGLKGALSPVKALLVRLSCHDGEFRPVDVTLDQALAHLEGYERRPVLRVLDRLCRDGDLVLVGEDSVDAQQPGPRLRNPTWRVVRDLRLRRDHQVQRRVTWRDKIWATLRGLRPRATTVTELMRLTGCQDASIVRQYLLDLARHGYAATRGKFGLEKAWCLLSDPGPKRPETEERP